MSSKTVAVMGGAFDPVHRDHVYVAELCLKKGFCDEVWFMPSPDRWDKIINASPSEYKSDGRETAKLIFRRKKK